MARSKQHLDWWTPVQYVKGVGPRRAGQLEKVGIRTVEDLLFHLPFRYEDRSRFATVSELREGEAVTLRGRIVGPSLRRTRRRGFTIFRSLIDDGTASVPCIWFNQPWLQDQLPPGSEIVLFAAPSRDRRTGRLQIENPTHELVEACDESIHTGRLVPVHQSVAKVGAKAIRSIVHAALEGLAPDAADPLPASLRNRRGLIDRRRAFELVHFPTRLAEVDPALGRLAFEELFLLELGLAFRRQGLDRRARTQRWPCPEGFQATAGRILPFELTGAQRRALEAGLADLARERPMHRLLQGDVGSGKTAVALLLMLAVVESGGQALLMAPTELLAEQHYGTLRRFLEPTDHHVALLTSSARASERRAILGSIASGMTAMVVGTHALLQEDVHFHRLGLAVVDEQHRFGVLQRAALRDKSNPHVLVMTATPIPRSLALTLYGDLDLTVIDEMPPGRRPVTTAVRDDAARTRVYAFLADEMRAGHQVYVVYPQIEETEETDLRAAVEGAEGLRRRYPDFEIGLVHGRLSREERDEVMDRFRARELDLLVATTVIEVGVDVPNATVMMVEHAERFGLSQLHQLRGRVGRGTARSWCILMRSSRITPEGEARLAAMVETQDGFRIAEKDLEIRGPGEFFGTRQSGMPPLRAANLVRDRHLLEEARAEAFSMIEGGSPPPGLTRWVREVWGERFGLVEVG